MASIRFRFPDLSQHSLEDVAIKKTRLNDDKIRELKAHLLDPGKSGANHVSRLEALAREVEASCPWEIFQGVLDIVVTYLPPLLESDQVPMDRILKALEKKTLFLVVDKSYHE